MKLLIFDIGSNSIRTAKLAEELDGYPVIKNKRVYTTRLAEGLAESGGLSQARMRQSLLVIRSVFQESSALGYACYAYATSAVRDAVNGHAFVRSIEGIIGAGHVRVLSGAEEAVFAQRGADPSRKRTILDIGGGSTQIVRANARESWPIGCVRAKDLAPYDDLKSIADILRPVLSGLFGMPDQDDRPDIESLPKAGAPGASCLASAAPLRRSRCFARAARRLRPGRAKKRYSSSISARRCKR
jgi:exopolyphosphatase/pppGpp-phosphohydrolase